MYNQILFHKYIMGKGYVVEWRIYDIYWLLITYIAHCQILHMALSLSLFTIHGNVGICRILIKFGIKIGPPFYFVIIKKASSKSQQRKKECFWR